MPTLVSKTSHLILTRASPDAVYSSSTFEPGKGLEPLYPEGGWVTTTRNCRSANQAYIVRGSGGIRTPNAVRRQIYSLLSSQLLNAPKKPDYLKPRQAPF